MYIKKLFKIMDKRKIRDSLRLAGALCFSWLYIPHILVFMSIGGCKRKLIISDLLAIESQINIRIPTFLQLLYQLHKNRYFRHVFYYRIGPAWDLVISWYRPGDKYFWVPFSTKVGKGLKYAHPYSTILKAESIGDNVCCIHCTTMGKKDGRRPRIGNNVTCGCHVAIIGDITIGNNVTIGAGAVVVKDVPDNAVVVGNPARVIKYKNSL